MRLALPVLVLALALGPATLAAADWRGAGGLEPDTSFDRSGVFMFQTPPTGAGDVYFQGFVAAPQTSLNPNLGVLGTRILPAPALHHRALLGEWVDCNGDGYIGHAESALMDYPAALLLNDTVCPGVTYLTDPVHNDRTWVNEFLFLGMVDPCEFALREVREARCAGVDAFAKNERVFYVNDTFVWADLGAPGSVPETECVLAPLPRGTTSGTGAMIGWSDCQSRRGIARAVNALDPNDALGLRFDDPSHPETSDSLLNQPFPVTPFDSPRGNGILQDDADAASATIWDCRATPLADVRDPEGRREVVVHDPTGLLDANTFPFVVVYTLTGLGFKDGDLRVLLTDEGGGYASVPFPAPAVHDPAGSSWGAADRAADGVAGDCDPSTPSRWSSAYPGSAIESDAAPIFEATKDRTSATFTFYDGHRGLHRDLDPFTGQLTPSDGGTLWLDHGRGGDGPMWSALLQSDQDPQLVDRDDLGFTPARYITYYAEIGADARQGAFDLPNAEAVSYGGENCGEFSHGVHAGWVCDPALWWRNANDEDNTPRYALGERLGRIPGDTYRLRDVDCYDGDLARGVGIHASLAILSAEGTCP